MFGWQLSGRQLIHSEYFLIDILEGYYNNGTSLGYSNKDSFLYHLVIIGRLVNR